MFIFQTCGPSVNTTSHVLWPATEGETCTLSIPGCIDYTTHTLQIKCCEGGDFDDVSCIYDTNIKDPRCFEGMQSTIGNDKSVNMCYTKDNSKYPVDCKSKTGRMISMDVKLLSEIGGVEQDIWVPIERFGKTFRYTSLDHLYMDPNQSSSPELNGYCMALINSMFHTVSCNEFHLGICLDYPYVIYKIAVGEMHAIFSSVKTFCNEAGSNRFCSSFIDYHTPLNIAYFSSRKYFSNQYIFLQKKNLRVVLQIGQQNVQCFDGFVLLFVALSKDDWATFSDMSVPFQVYDYTQEEELTTPPKIAVIKYDTSIFIKGYFSENIKSIQKDTCSVYCFFNDSDTLKKIDVEINTIWPFTLDLDRGSIWCEAFDYDLNIIKSNVLEIQSKNESNGYISRLIIVFKNSNKCTLNIEVIQNLIEAATKDDRTFIPSIEVKTCEIYYKNVDVRIMWYLIQPVQTVEEIDENFLRLKGIITNMQKVNSPEIEYISVLFLGHTDYCLKDIMYFENRVFIWPTLPKNQCVSSKPLCYQVKQNVTTINGRQCVAHSTGNNQESSWMDVKSCNNNLTFILEQLLLLEDNDNAILDDLNILLEYWYHIFKPLDVHLLSEILSRLSHSQTIYQTLSTFPRIVSNLHKIEKEVLRHSQEQYNATDSILDTLTNLYATYRTKEPFTDTYYSNVAVDLIPPFIIPEYKIPYLELIMSYLTFYPFSNHVVLSIFFKNYLFYGDLAANHDDAIIFQALTPDSNHYVPFTIFPINVGIKGQYCSCWNYGLSSINSKWQNVTVIKEGSKHVCIFKTASYCSVFHSDSEMQFEYVSKLSINYNVFLIFYSYSLQVALNEILDKVFSAEADISLEIEETVDYFISTAKYYFLRFNFAIPQGSVHDIELESERLYKCLQKVSVMTNDVITKIEVQYIHHREFCKYEATGDTESGIFEWPLTKVGHSAESIPTCYSSNEGRAYIVTRKCLDNATEGAYWEESQPCSLSSEVTNGLQYLIDNFNYTVANDVLNKVDNMIKNIPQYFDSKDLSLIAQIFELLSSVTEQTVLEFSSLSSIASGVQMLNASVLLDSQKNYNSTDRILYNLDTILISSKVQGNYSLKNPEFYVTGLSSCKNCRGAILQVFENHYNVTIVEDKVDYNLLTEYENFEAAIVFNDSLLKDIHKLENYSVIIAIFFKDVLFNEVTAEHKVTNVFGILIPNYKAEIFPGAINLIYKNDIHAKDCAFWEYGNKNRVPISGSWKKEGNSHLEKTFFTCQYNHTTHFAMLIGSADQDSEIATVLTNIGCTLSIAGLLGILVTGLIFEKWRRNVGNIILSNFVLTILFQIGLYYLSGFVKIFFAKTDACIFTGAFLHYSVVSEFCWMLIIAVLQFKRFVQVFTGPPKYLILKSLFVGWVLPFVPVVSILATDPNSYTSGMDELCYPTKLGLYLGVWLPIAIIIFINFIIFSYIMYSIFHRKTECVDTVTNEVIFQWRLAFLLFFMLGLTWSFAFIGQFVFSDLFLNLFSLCATLQGFVMFLFFIVFDKRTRSMYTLLFKKLLKKYTF
ncbi:hypothetical protein WA026_017498 [Henosepilachna vigintioctopunctata]|uniref:G-protein coupled receptors family 2 profile 2 domain-containing protein n=1 Tax=Henosepilachna vigintioctopunctata TaxID=420089 RepID=A0AAW1UVQ5_9CUCU